MKLAGTEYVEHWPTKVDQNPVVSVIVLAYNNEAYIETCVRSIAEQNTNFPFEIVLGEDNSMDGTRMICKQLADKFSAKIKLILHDRRNVMRVDGIATGFYNLIYGYQSSKSKYVAICDGDDYWLDSNKLQRQVDELEQHRDVNLCVTKTATDSISGLSYPDKYPVQTRFAFENLVANWFVNTSSMMWRRSALEFPSWLFDCLSFDRLWSYLLLTTGSGILIPEYLSCYRVHEGGISNRMTDEGLKRIKKFLGYLDREEFHEFQGNGGPIEGLKKYEMNKMKLMTNPSFFKRNLLLGKSIYADRNNELRVKNLLHAAWPNLTTALLKMKR